MSLSCRRATPPAPFASIVSETAFPFPRAQRTPIDSKKAIVSATVSTFAALWRWRCDPVEVVRRHLVMCDVASPAALIRTRADLLCAVEQHDASAGARRENRRHQPRRPSAYDRYVGMLNVQC